MAKRCLKTKKGFLSKGSGWRNGRPGQGFPAKLTASGGDIRTFSFADSGTHPERVQDVPELPHRIGKGASEFQFGDGVEGNQVHMSFSMGKERTQLLRLPGSIVQSSQEDVFVCHLPSGFFQRNNRRPPKCFVSRFWRLLASDGYEGLHPARAGKPPGDISCRHRRVPASDRVIPRWKW